MLPTDVVAATAFAVDRAEEFVAREALDGDDALTITEQLAHVYAVAALADNGTRLELSMTVPAPNAVSAAIGGAEAGQIFEGDRRFDVVVRLADEARNDPAAHRTSIIA